MAKPGERLPARLTRRAVPSPSAVIELLKPVTWFAPMWALGCGVVSAGVPVLEHLPSILGAALLAGPLVCGTSQACNDWFDRHVDAINEPNRPIPSGRVPGRWGLGIAIAWTALSLAVGWALGPWVFVASIVGLLLAWAYSAPPLRLKLNGWWGNAAVGLCYEGLPWFTGAAALTVQMPDAHIGWLALLYSVGAFGIMVLNDFKAVEGDQALGVRSLPVQLGVRPAAVFACVVMAIPQVVVVAMLAASGRPVESLVVAGLLAAQLLLMPMLIRNPRKRAPLYNATGTTCFVLGMLVSGFAVRALDTLG
ncbi:MAG: chlorophyll synthase ChlG [Deltaproteobacteria bacterium]|nr:chlorophyll synthase ChlG [Deltaproteobacteria bacterium]MBK8240289.1 chlorophyll synthase ChlG [Deltaproteobacteria bacterium]MBK8714556.1 chlorophyll synthase ChlG [Deltaproteobacteria bacterium]MBP7291570.1 chlorophyll synthase ChlG [Nannocystaceae bacterium]